jgi:Arc/MetJ family transcription regulator
MAAVPVSKLSESEVAQLACTYASLLLHDDGIDITDKLIAKVIKSSGLKV